MPDLTPTHWMRAAMAACLSGLPKAGRAGLRSGTSLVGRGPQRAFPSTVLTLAAFSARLLGR